MLTNINLTVWDGLLIVVVTAQSLAMAYSESPRVKRLFLTLPFPFTVIALSVGRPIDGSTFFSILVLFAYTQVCRILHTRCGVPIIPTIVTGVLFYASTGWILADVIPTGDGVFWVGSTLTVGIGFLLSRWLTTVNEIPYRTTLPFVYKLPVLLVVSSALVLIKNGLQGFAGFFPLISVIGAYETRTTLWTLARPVPVLMITMTPMLIVARLIQPTYGLGLGLVLGWVAFLVAFVIVKERVT